MSADSTTDSGTQIISLGLEDQKRLLYNRLRAEADGFSLKIDEANCSIDRPWGAYLRLQDESLEQFLDAYYFDLKDRFPATDNRHLAPKLLLVAPGSRLSLQYHHRRGEYWRVLTGPVRISLGEDGASLQERVYNTGDAIKIPCGHWHRLAGMSGWAVIAELWDHTDPANPSDEDDIVRVEDDFSRKTV